MPNFKLSAESGTFKLTGFPAELRIHTPLPDNHPAYALIGRAASEWARIEHILDMIIWELAGLDQMTGSCMTTPQFGYRARLNIIMALVTRIECQLRQRDKQKP